MKTKICKKAGCGRTCEQGKNYCYLHKDLETKKKIFTFRGKSKTYHNLYETYRWRTFSKDFLKTHPFCYICGAKATVVDHIIPHRGDLSLFYDVNNVQPLCQSCHSRKTMQENNYFHKKNGGQN